MKKLILQTLTAAVVLLLAACSGGADAVSKKIDNHEKLSQEDYSVMIDYVEDAFNSLSELTTKYGNQPNKLREEAEKLEKKYSHIDQFTQTIISASDLDEKNQKKLENLQGIILKAMGINPETMRTSGNPQIDVPAPAEDSAPELKAPKDLPDTLR